ncbi:MAG TPA: methyltransferase domain-containing protein [Deltaproteobacteria bacterium]|nr:methyltransferase domain-containing protein [Deltaproteobacteria bacterium]HQI82635.1 methyltransferase domain-containing protein [Deltaproteobacteria bacterium]
MSGADGYLMENPEEALRLDVKTDPEAVAAQARLCGIGPGMRVLDGGCGSGKTSAVLSGVVRPGGSVVGIDFGEDRIRFARKTYGETAGVEFACRDLRHSLEDLGEFDAVWMRFVLEYYRQGALDIVRNTALALKPQGRMCLLDLDYNCLSHYPLGPGMEAVLHRLVETMALKYNFDPYAGRRLYAYLYGLGFRDIRVDLVPHHLIYGELRPSDDFNWIKKIEMASRRAPELFHEYPGGYEGYFRDFNAFFHDPGRFTYTPLIVCTGLRPASLAAG